MNMETIAVANFYIFLIVGFIGIFMGLNLKMWTSWLYGLYGFLTGLFLGSVFLNPSSGLQLGTLFAFAVMFGGASVRRGRERYK
jgi:hypothetical protein